MFVGVFKKLEDLSELGIYFYRHAIEYIKS